MDALQSQPASILKRPSSQGAPGKSSWRRREGTSRVSFERQRLRPLNSPRAGASSNSPLAANRLAHPREQGSQNLGARNSTAMALSNIVERLLPGSTSQSAGTTPSASAAAQQRASEREPLLRSEARDGEDGDAVDGTSAGPSYGAVTDLPAEQRVPKPKKVRGPVRVEAKVWFANERTWISWLRVSLLIGSFSLAMYNSANFFQSQPQEPSEPGSSPSGPSAATIRTFAIVYALIAVLTLAWGLFNYHRRVHLIRTKFPGNFDDLIGPPVVCLALFIAVLTNFIVRVQQHTFDDGA